MRMWGVPPEEMCNKHLLGEHVEMHMFVGTILKGISIKGYTDKGLVNPHNIYKRHEELAKEMIKRRMNHKSPIKLISAPLPIVSIAVERNRRELKKRCPRCNERIMK